MSTSAASEFSAAPALVQRALELHRSGKSEQAEELYHQALVAEPGHTNALYLLALLRIAQRDDQAARELLERAVTQSPEQPAFHANLGFVYRRLGLLDEAATSLRRALALKPDLAEAAFNLGLTLEDLKRFDEAVAAFERACAVRPRTFDYRHRLARALRGRARAEEAVSQFGLALELEPSSVTALLELGSTLHGLGRRADAHTLHRRALDLAPDYAPAHESQGLLWLDEHAYERAAECFRRALELDATRSTAHANLGHACKGLALLDLAIEHYRRALVLDPGDHQTHSALLYTLGFHPAYDEQALLDEARRWGARHARSDLERRHPNPPAPDRRLRVGYVSPDFRDHCQALFTVPLLRHHDPRAVEVFCYSDVVRPDAISARLRSYAHHVRDTALLGDAELEALIVHDDIDLLVDLTMHMGGNRLRLFARRPAPVQISWLAYPGTTGVDGIDYRLSDPWLDPPARGRGPYTERTQRLPDSFWCYDPLCEATDVGELPALRRRHVTFGCLNNFCKVNDATLALWARVLDAVPGSRLRLLAPRGQARSRVAATWTAAGGDPQRLEFFDAAPRPRYLEAYRELDLCLDTLPYNGHTTSLDAFWMGVPTVSLVGRTVVGRAGLSLAMNLGLPELVAREPDEFVACAAALARDLPRLAGLRRELRARLQASPLMDGPRFASNVETVYRTLWRTWCARNDRP